MQIQKPHTLAEMSQDDSTPEKLMLKHFYDYHNGNLSREICQALNEYVSTKPNGIAGVLAILFQLPYPGLSKHQVEQAIAETETNDHCSESSTITEAWVVLDQLDQPSESEKCDLFSELSKCCASVLIVDLIKLVCQYLSGNACRVFVGTELYALDSANSWECAEITQIILMGGEYFVYIVYKAWNTKWNEWIPINSARLRWMKNKQGQLIPVRPALSCELVQPGQYVDYLRLPPSFWVKAKVIKTIDEYIEIDLVGYTSGAIGSIRIAHHTFRSRRLAPHGTFT